MLRTILDLLCLDHSLLCHSIIGYGMPCAPVMVPRGSVHRAAERHAAIVPNGVSITLHKPTQQRRVDQALLPDSMWALNNAMLGMAGGVLQAGLN
jgi:hypothetical protein